MEVTTELKIEVLVDTSSARREVEEFRRYALGVVDEVRAAFAVATAETGLPGLSEDGPARRA